MQPNDPLQQPQPQPLTQLQSEPQQFSNDYLNQIAAPAQVKKVNPFMLWGLIGGVLLLIIVVIVAVSSNSGSGGSTASLTKVGLKLTLLKTISEKAQKNIQSGELRSINSSLTLALTNANRDMTEPLKIQKIKLTDKKNKTVVQVTSDFDDLASRLEDARLNAVYDRTYAREMSYELKTLHSDMAILYKSTKSKSLKDALNTTDTNLEALLDSFSSFNAS